ncbi:PIN domain-containing protein [Nostoc sp. 'Peltigera membranacea cyanobiont' 210A]|uniref:PIN domain-containing protein n=1 Tax=Nostoc sp. 'Peltigera membranacea cyanobiont' 210A TaxID=2014529 RepID=UPI000B952567|nr:PIN domain-containing protein [Nostoc sp. 'Peltigera membranacea cyanobiont' 210A]
MIIYVETNFLMSIAKGQDSQAQELLQNPPSSLRIVVPSICFVESLTTLEQEEKYNLDFLRNLDIQINQAERDNSSNARSLLSHLEKSRISFLQRSNEVKERFDVAFNRLINTSEMIILSKDIFQLTLNRAIFEKHIIDRIILECIIFHAGLHPNENKVFLSSNSKEFGRREVLEILRDREIQYFNKTQNFLGWLQSQSN